MKGSDEWNEGGGGGGQEGEEEKDQKQRWRTTRMGKTEHGISAEGV